MIGQERGNFALQGYNGGVQGMKYAYRLGKAMMLPVAGLLMGLGYWIDPSGYGSGSLVAEIMIQAGSALMNNMSLLFALGVATGLADEQDGTAAIASVAAWLVIQNLLAVDNIEIGRAHV